MRKRAKELLALPHEELRALGTAGKEKKNEAEEAEVRKLYEKHHVD
jgi:hypothetical protein